jgi:hypothetical protein
LRSLPLKSVIVTDPENPELLLISPFTMPLKGVIAIGPYYATYRCNRYWSAILPSYLLDNFEFKQVFWRQVSDKLVVKWPTLLCALYLKYK